MNPLAGHRDRLRQRLQRAGLEALGDHEVLELLLSYAIARRDVKPIARELLARFGSLSNVLDTPAEQLQAVDGVGPTAATLLHLVPDLTRRYLHDRWGRRPRLDTHGTATRFVAGALAAETYEVFLLIGLNHNFQLLQAQRLHEGSLTAAPVYPRLVVEAALRMKAAHVILAHNHPGGVARPSAEDEDVTRKLVEVLEAIGIAVLDHVIVAGPETYSFAAAGRLRPAT